MDAPVDGSAGKATAAVCLQRLLPRLIDLSRAAEQAHGNVSGQSFLAVKALTNQIADNTRKWADCVVERALTLGYAGDDRTSTEAATGGSPRTSASSDAEAIADLGVHIRAVVHAARSTLVGLKTSDPLAYTIAVTIIEGLDKYRWMACEQPPQDAGRGVGSCLKRARAETRHARHHDARPASETSNDDATAPSGSPRARQGVSGRAGPPRSAGVVQALSAAATAAWESLADA
jgi:starvation-inducible DNA-binding protein